MSRWIGGIPVGSTTTLAGTTAGQAVWVQPFVTATYKQLIVWLNGYQNNTVTAQTIVFPTPFLHAPYLAHDDSGGSTVSATQLTLPISMATTKTGWVVVEGF